MAEEDILAQAASTTQSMIPQQKDLTSFGPQPLTQPPPMPHVNMDALRPQVAQGGFASSGARKRADKQAIFNNIANLVKTGSDYIEAKKQRNLSMTIERLMSAQEGLQEAKDSGNQEGIAKNTAIINDLTSDPKVAKQLQKAFNIDLFGNGKNKSENQALVDAWKGYNQKKQTDPSALNPTAQRLQASQPMRQQLSPEAQAQAMAIKAGLVPKAGEILKASFENLRTLQTAKSSEDRNAILDKIGQDRVNAVKYHADKVLDAAIQRGVDSKDLARIKFASDKYRADLTAATWDKRLAKMDEWAKMKTGDSPIFKKLIGEAKTYNDRLKVLSTENAKMQGELDKQSPSAVGRFFGQHAPDTPDTRMMKNKIMMNNLEMNQVQNDLGSVTKKMQLMDTMGVINMKELSSGDSSGSDGGGSEEGITVDDSEVPE
jgi:hypothetical protein